MNDISRSAHIHLYSSISTSLADHTWIFIKCPNGLARSGQSSDVDESEDADLEGNGVAGRRDVKAISGMESQIQVGFYVGAWLCECIYAWMRG